mmetsp:Transcript_6598/g.27335  ORF Transcript_6598/g.27335 Transcript_6598/m.27335 type:complete len:365 (-) Transcript_6598:3040-4134(-)
MCPPMTAMVAGTAPSARITSSTSRAVSRFCGQGMPWAMMVDSRATTGRPSARAAATSGESWIRAFIGCAKNRVSVRGGRCPRSAASARPGPGPGERPHRDRRRAGHADRHLQGRRHDPPQHGDDAGLHRHRCAYRAGAAAAAREGSRRRLLQPHHHRWRHLDQRLLHADREPPGPPCRDHRARQCRGAGPAQRLDFAGPGTGPGHRAGWRGRHQVHHDHGRRWPRRGRVQARGLRDRPLAAGQDSLLRQRPQPGPHPGGGRLCRHCGPGPGPDRTPPRRCACRQPRWPPARVPRGGWPARDEAERDHDPRRPESRSGPHDRLDLRPQPRLRQHQRRLPQLTDRRPGRHHPGKTRCDDRRPCGCR